MKTFSYLFLSLFLLSSCKSVEDINPLTALTDGIKNDEGPNDTATSSTTLEYMELVNSYRLRIGLRALLLDTDMAAVATTHSLNMAAGSVAFGHAGFSDRCERARDIMGNGNLCGEIVASGQDTAEDVFEAWMNSSGHRAKIEEGRYTHTGFGFAKSAKGTIYWTQIFLEVK